MCWTEQEKMALEHIRMARRELDRAIERVRELPEESRDWWREAVAKLKVARQLLHEEEE